MSRSRARNALIILIAAVILRSAVLASSSAPSQIPPPSARVERLIDRPIITPDLDPSLEPNIQGPSLIKVPEWVPGRLGGYYLYFANHKGRYKSDVMRSIAVAVGFCSPRRECFGGRAARGRR